MSKVSVIIPTYNRADMLGDALDSVMAQTYADWEAIVVDDGSTDDIQMVMARYSDARIRYVYQANRGLSAARNTGIRNAESEFVAFLDSDDVFLPDRLRKQMALVQADANIGLVAGGCIEVDKALRPLREVQAWHGAPVLDLATLASVCPFCPSAVLAKRDWVVRAGWFDEGMKRIEDWDMWLRMAYLGCPCVWVTEAVCLYRIHGGNMVRDVALMCDGMIATMDKLFAHTDLPPNVVQQRNAVYAHAYLNGACRAYAAGLLDEGKNYLSRAIEVDPSLLQGGGVGHPPKALNSLAAFSLLPLSGDSEKYITTVMHNLPDNATSLKQWSVRRAQGLVHAVAAFEAAQRAEKPVARKHAWMTFWRHPAWLRNRGLLRIASGL